MTNRTLLAAALAALALPAACAKKEKAPTPPPATTTATPPANPAMPPGHPPMPPQRPDIPAPPDVAAAPATAQKTQDGIAYEVLQPGKEGGEHPGPTDTVTVNYTGWTTDGHMFDSSVKRGMPATFPLDRVIPGWRESVMLMTPGEKARFWIPAELAYKGHPGAPQGTLVFDIELMSVKPGPKPLPVPPTPKDVAAPPKDAKKDPDGLAWKVLKPGTGTVHPSATSIVQVHYAGWTTDGKMFDNSYARGEPATFPLGGVIKGWTEGLQHMVEGETARFWIPEELAYKGRPGAPQGMLVFDVQLLKILNPMMPPGHPGMPPGHPGAPPTGNAK